MEGTMTKEAVDTLVENFLAIKVRDDLMENVDAQALEVLIAIPRSPGDSYTDEECVEMIAEVTDHWRKLKS
jgi:hypothetical protein